MKKLGSIQVLRAIAAVLVIFCHGAGEVGGSHAALWPGFWPLVSAKGLFGVDLFFVVSGFVMMYIISGKRSSGMTAARFLGERIARIVPLYWAVTLLSVLIGLVLPALKHKNDYAVDYVLRSLLFIPSSNPLTGAPEPVLGLGWTLNYEMFFYVVISLVLLLGVRRVFAAVLAIFVSLVVLGIGFDPADVILKSWTHTIILEFAFGAVLAEARLSGFRMGLPVQIVLVLAGIAGWMYFGPPSDSVFALRGFGWGLPAAAIFAGVVMGRREVTYPRLLLLIGDGSYSLYLTHLFVMRLCSLLVFHLPIDPALRVVVFFIVFPCAAIGFSILSYRKFEMPTLRFGRQLLEARLSKARIAEGASSGG